MGLRILLVVDSYFPGTGGTERQLAQLAPRLRESGHHVEILCPRLLDSMPHREMHEGVPVRRVDYPRVPKFGAALMLMRIAVQVLLRYRQFDVIHVHIVNNIAPIVGALRPFLKCLLVAKISGATELSGGLLDPEYRDRVSSRLRNFFMRRFDYIQVISRQTREALIAADYDPHRLIGIPNGVNTHSFAAHTRARSPADAVKAVYAGRLRHVKGVDILLRAWADVVTTCQADLIILGDGEEIDNLRELADSLDITDRVTFLGDCGDVAPYFAQSDLYIQPSRHEGLPNAVIEAMAAGLPVVASSVGGNRDLIRNGETGLLVGPESSGDLATAVRSLLLDERQRRRLGESARDFAVENYSMESVVDRLLSLYSTRSLEVAVA